MSTSIITFIVAMVLESSCAKAWLSQLLGLLLADNFQLSASLEAVLLQESCLPEPIPLPGRPILSGTDGGPPTSVEGLYLGRGYFS